MIQVFKSSGDDWFLMRLCVHGPLEQLQAFRTAVKARQGYSPGAEDAALDVARQSALPAECEFFRVIEERGDYVIYELDSFERPPRKLIATLAREWPMLVFDASVYRMRDRVRLRCPATPTKTRQNALKAR